MPIAPSPVKPAGAGVPVAGRAEEGAQGNRESLGGGPASRPGAALHRGLGREGAAQARAGAVASDQSRARRDPTAHQWPPFGLKRGCEDG